MEVNQAINKSNYEHYQIDKMVVSFMEKNHDLQKVMSQGKVIAERRLLEVMLRKTLKELSDIKFAIDQAAIVAITDQKVLFNM